MSYKHKLAGVYIWLNTSNGHRYVGSSINLQYRHAAHLRELRRSTHNNPHLQSAFNLYGESSFIFEVIEQVSDPDILLEREQYHIDALSPEYNVLLKAGNSLGYKHLPEACRKMSENSKASERPIRTEEQKRRIAASLKGKTKSAETRVRMSVAAKRRMAARMVANKAAKQ